MAKNTWVYASLPASERKERIRGGDKELYDSEIARSLDVIGARQALGLDIGEQKDWIDSISYDYNLSNAARMGIDESDVSRTGYADRLLGGEKPKKHGESIHMSPDYKKWDQAYAYLDEYTEKVNAMKEKRKNLDEWLLNNGIDKNGGEAKRFYDAFDEEVKLGAAKLKEQFVSKLKSIGFVLA